MVTIPRPLSRRTVLGASAGLSAVALTGCVPGAGNTNNQPAEDQGTQASGPLTVWHYYGGGATEPFEKLLAGYADEAGVEVTPRLIPFGDFNRTLLQSATAGDLPDVALINAFDVPLFADAGLIIDLSERVTAWGEQDSYAEAPFKSTQFNGGTYALPHVADTYSLWFNEALIAQPPATWAELEQVGAEIDGNGLAYCGVEGVEGATAVILRFLSAGGEMASWNSPAGKAAFESLRRMQDQGITSKGVLTWIEDDVYTQFKNKSAAMMINSASYMSTLTAEAPDLKFGVAPIPKDAAQTSFLSAENWTITKDSTQAGAAWQMITQLQQPDVMNAYLPERNKLPVRADVAAHEQWQDPKRKVFIDQLDVAYAPDEKTAPVSAEIFVAVQSALQEVLVGGAIPQILTTLQTAIDDALGS